MTPGAPPASPIIELWDRVEIWIYIAMLGMIVVGLIRMIILGVPI